MTEPQVGEVFSLRGVYTGVSYEMGVRDGRAYRFDLYDEDTRGVQMADVQSSNLAPWLSAGGIATLGRLTSVVHAVIRSYPEACEEEGSVMQAMLRAFEDTEDVRERLRGRAEGWA